MRILLTLIISSIASWRIASLLQKENGPFNIFIKIRDYVGVTKVDDLPLNEQLLYPNEEYISNGTFFAEMISCIMCLSVWIGGLISLYLGFTKMIEKSWIPLFTLAISAITILLENRRIFNGE